MKRFSKRNTTTAGVTVTTTHAERNSPTFPNSNNSNSNHHHHNILDDHKRSDSPAAGNNNNNTGIVTSSSSYHYFFTDAASVNVNANGSQQQSVEYSPKGSKHSHSRITSSSSSSISPRMKRISKPFVYAMDFFVCLCLLQALIIYLLSDGHEEIGAVEQEQDDNMNNNKNHISPIILQWKELSSSTTTTTTTTSFRRQSTFQETFEEFESMPCTPSIEDEKDDISITLAIALVEKDLEKVPHHCRRWGIEAPISIAVWTDLSPTQIANKLFSFPSSICHPDQMTITTVATTTTTTATATFGNNIRNRLRNLAIQGATTTHVLPIDIHMWTSVDLYETLHTPKIRQTLADDPYQTILIPAFEMNKEACSTDHPDDNNNNDNEKKKKKKCHQDVPRNFDDLIVRLGEKSIYPMDPMDYELQGDADYRSWVRQSRSSLLSIECVSSSNRFQPFLVVRKCQHLPPFQEILSTTTDPNSNGSSNVHANDPTWIAHLIHVGYTMKQLGGEFVVYLPPKSATDPKFGFTDEMALPTAAGRGRGGGGGYKTNMDFFRWLDRSVPNRRVVSVCQDEEEDPVS
ncbi:glycosyl-transferase [Nitzschia inconspicua]|uniref:Glycosyl-transferase n=1 Tax=Nitzschia inconspicua TaxID=303405 RepID=A0A9K3KUG2_9STRA|nr:glycosyl-transferase [Nitzschia inconspicua]